MNEFEIHPINTCSLALHAFVTPVSNSVEIPGGILIPRRLFYPESSSGVLSKIGQIEVKPHRDWGTLHPPLCNVPMMGWEGSPSMISLCPFWLAGRVAICLLSLAYEFIQKLPVGGWWGYLFRAEGVHLWSLVWGMIWSLRGVEKGIEAEAWLPRHGIQCPYKGVPQNPFPLALFWQVPSGCFSLSIAPFSLDLWVFLGQGDPDRRGAWPRAAALQGVGRKGQRGKDSLSIRNWEKIVHLCCSGSLIWHFS